MRHEHIIKGDNILLRPLNENDLETLMNWRNKDKIREWFLNNRVITKEEQIVWFERYISNNDDMMFIIEDTTLNLPIGVVALYNIDNTRNIAEFGRLMIGEEIARGKSIGYKASKLICHFAFSTLNMNEVYLSVLANNTPAINIYEKVGFKGTCNYIINDKDLIMMNIVR
ncbi:MAG TPA: N-acetyltransferase [Clostridiales bacterium]|nr:MAG: hypothetical protein A2Y22_04310 [Clostridiales bacterium GWD2_32_59]HAN10434.1 N-acetyltransferase [Clostridiales bacterium]